MSEGGYQATDLSRVKDLEALGLIDEIEAEARSLFQATHRLLQDPTPENIRAARVKRAHAQALMAQAQEIATASAAMTRAEQT